MTMFLNNLSLSEKELKKTLEQLEEKGLVKSFLSEDGNIKYAITEQGKAIVEQIKKGENDGH